MYIIKHFNLFSLLVSMRVTAEFLPINLYTYIFIHIHISLDKYACVHVNICILVYVYTYILCIYILVPVFFVGPDARHGGLALSPASPATVCCV